MDNLKDKQSIENIARVCHEVNRAWCISNGDFSQKTWDEAPEWQKDSARAGVVFNLENPDAPPSASHDSWMKKKIEDGWTYGAVKDEEAKTHPCLVEFDKLPIDQMRKDIFFKSVVMAFIGAQQSKELFDVREKGKNLVKQLVDFGMAREIDKGCDGHGPVAHMMTALGMGGFEEINKKIFGDSWTA